MHDLNDEQDKLQDHHATNGITRRVFDLYISLFQTDQCEEIKLHILASFRFLINKTPSIFLESHPIFCSILCLEVSLEKKEKKDVLYSLRIDFFTSLAFGKPDIFWRTELFFLWVYPYSAIRYVESSV